MAETEIHDILRNDRRRRVLEQLRATVGTVQLRELAESLAEAETGESPPPKNIRKSVYNSLHQTHLPKLDAEGVIDYDRDRKVVRPAAEVRELRPYLEVETAYGVPWARVYRWLAIGGFLAILLVLVGAPGLTAVDPVVLTAVCLLAATLGTIYQLWRDRWLLLGGLR